MTFGRSAVFFVLAGVDQDLSDFGAGGREIELVGALLGAHFWLCRWGVHPRATRAICTRAVRSASFLSDIFPVRRLWTTDPVSTLRESLAAVIGQWIRASYADAASAAAALGVGGNARMREVMRNLFAAPRGRWWATHRSQDVGRDPVDILAEALLRAGAQLPGVTTIFRDIYYFSQIAAAELSVESTAHAMQIRSGKPLIEP